MLEQNIQAPIHSPRMVINVENESLVSFKFEVLYIPLFSGHLPADSTHFHELVKTCFVNLDTLCVKVYHLKCLHK